MKYLQYLLVPLIIAVCVIFTASLLEKHKPRQKTWQEEGRVRPDAKVYAEWTEMEKNVIVINDIGALEKLVYQMPIEGALTEVQLRELRSSVKNLIAGYMVPNFKDYMNFRLPVDSGSWDSSIIKAKRDAVRKYLPNATELYDLKSEYQVFEGWFRYTMVRMGYDAKREPITDKNRFNKGFVQGLSLEDSKIIASSLNILPKPLNMHVTDSRNNGYWNSTSTYVFSPSPEAVLKKQGIIVYAILKITLKTDLDGIMPQYFSLYWIPDHGKWFPMEYCFPSTRGRKNLFAF